MIGSPSILVIDSVGNLVAKSLFHLVLAQSISDKSDAKTYGFLLELGMSDPSLRLVECKAPSVFFQRFSCSVGTSQFSLETVPQFSNVSLLHVVLEEFVSKLCSMGNQEGLEPPTFRVILRPGDVALAPTALPIELLVPQDQSHVLTAYSTSEAWSGPKEVSQ